MAEKKAHAATGDTAEVSAREAELARQKAVEQAVHDATHNEDGSPKPLGVADHLPAPAGITIVEGKP